MRNNDGENMFRGRIVIASGSCLPMHISVLNVNDDVQVEKCVLQHPRLVNLNFVGTSHTICEMCESTNRLFGSTDKTDGR